MKNMTVADVLAEVNTTLEDLFITLNRQVTHDDLERIERAVIEKLEEIRRG